MGAIFAAVLALVLVTKMVVVCDVTPKPDGGKQIRCSIDDAMKQKKVVK